MTKFSFVLDSSKLEEAVSKGEGRATLRLKKDGQAVVEEVTAWESKAAERVDDLLESFMGIRDLELGTWRSNGKLTSPCLNVWDSN